MDPLAGLPVAAGPHDAWELEQVVPGCDWDTSYDPIIEAVELAACAERERARGLLVSLLAEDLRCLDAHAHLGSFAHDYSAALGAAALRDGCGDRRAQPAGGV